MFTNPIHVMRKFNSILLFLICIAFAANAQPGDAPPNAQPGKCYAKCHIPDQYETVTEQVMIKPASTRTIAVPAEYETKTEQQLVKAESKRIIAVPAQYETVTEKVVIKAASKRLVPVPAQYETVDERVMIKPESKRVISVPAEYETVTDKVMVKPEGKRLVEVPAVYETVTEQYEMEAASTKTEVLQPKYETVTERVEVKPASTKWVKKKADANCLSANPDDCLVWCLVEVPAEYQTITKRVNKGCDGSGVADAGCTKTIQIPAKMGTRTVRKVKTPATTREEVIPAEYKTMTVRKVKTPATTREEVIPAEYATVKKQVLKTPASVREEEIPAEYATVTKQVLKSPATTREEVIPAEYKAVTVKGVKAAASTKTEPIPAEYTTITKRRLVKPGGSRRTGVQKECLVYELYNILTDQSFGVIRASVSFANPGKKGLMNSFSFLIESEKDLASRLNARPVKPRIVTHRSLDTLAFDRLALFEYMIGNTDWSVRVRHNIKVLYLLPNGPTIPVPYDFDYAGVVGTDYALPDPQLPIRSVQERYYMGACREKSDYQRVFRLFKSKKETILEHCNQFPDLPRNMKKQMTNYLGEFFQILADPALATREIEDNCGKVSWQCSWQ